MSRRHGTDLFTTLRASGLRRKVAQTVTEASRKGRSGKQARVLDRTIENLRFAAGEIERRVAGTKRSEAAKKAARTRKRTASARSRAARKAAKTRARKGP